VDKLLAVVGGGAGSGSGPGAAAVSGPDDDKTLRRRKLSPLALVVIVTIHFIGPVLPHHTVSA